MKKTEHFLLPLLIVSLLIVQLMSPVTVFADGETPPVTSESTDEVTPPDEPVETDEASVKETAPADEPSAPAETLVEETNPEGTPADEVVPENAPGVKPDVETEDLTVAEALEQAPTETEIVVVNAEGQVEPLASAEAAEIVAAADPLWCPTGQAPTPGANGCTSSYTSLQALLGELDSNEATLYNKAGTIWIEDDYDSSVNDAASTGFILDGGAFTTMKDYALTIQGGWDGTDGSTNISGTSTFTGDYLLITNWNAAVTLNDIVVDSVSNNGIKVTTTGDINLENVESSKNTSSGAYLDNTTGSGNITLSGTNTFNENGGYGLRAYSKGNIILNDVTASKNFQGAHLKNNKGNGDITLSGTNTFNENGDYGLVAVSKGNINLNNLTASQNSLYGADLSGSGSIALTGASTFYNNSNYGLRAFSDGNISLNNLTASQNIQYGAYLNNTSGTGNIILTGTSIFAGNSTYGLKAYSNGNININNVTASQNTEHGADINNTYGSGNITLSGTNTFTGNSFYGLHAYSKGYISLNDVTASQNTQYGANLNNSTGSGDITLTGTNSLNENGEYGLVAIANGNISINNLTASQNILHGADLSNATFSGDISLTGMNTFINNSFYGLRAYSDENISINNMTASQNIQYGAYLNNTTGNGNISLTGTNIFNNNGEYGLRSYSNRSISINNVTASQNTQHGTFLDNSYGSGDITLTGTNNFNTNGGYNLYTKTNGNIMIENITAYGNGGTSLYLDPPAGKPANITINCGNIYNNGSGLEAFLSGTLTLNGVTFNNNGTDFINNGGTLVVNPDYCNPISDTVITPISGTDKQSAYAPTKSINQVSATGGAVELSCELYSGTQLSLPSGDSVYFPCPIKGTATLAGIEETQADLPDGSTFQSGFTIEVTENGKSTDKLSAFATISFAIPAGVDVSSLAILYWNGSEWVEQVGFVNADGLYFQTTVNFTGTFVLVSVE